jgi:hypothetical protein
LNEPAFDELLQRLAEADVEFVVVGGLALNAWGVVRGTKDVDVVIATDSDNVKRVAEVAVAAGGHVQQGEAFLEGMGLLTRGLEGNEESSGTDSRPCRSRGLGRSRRLGA